VSSGILIHAAAWLQFYMGQYWGYCAPFYGWGEAGSLSNTIPPGPRSTTVPGGILIHPAVWPQHGRAASPSNNVARAEEAYLHAKFYLDAFNRLATIRQRYRQTGQTDRQRSDSMGRTVLQTVAQKRCVLEVLLLEIGNRKLRAESGTHTATGSDQNVIEAEITSSLTR